jgi:hypothetical protein
LFDKEEEMTDFLTEFKQRMSELLEEKGSGPFEKMGIEGCVITTLIGPDGNVKQKGMFRNLVNSAGDMYIAQYMAGSIVGNVGSMYAQLGVNTTAPVKGGTGLGTLISTSSLANSSTYPVRVNSFGTGPGEWTTWRFSWGAGVATNGSIGEVGMWTQANSFVAHAQVAPNVNKAAGDTLQVDWGWKFLGT